jgi:hypothetical protein
MRRTALPLLLLLAACATPQEQCIFRETRELRTVEKLIAETEANLARGYALEERTVYVPRWKICGYTPIPRGEGEPPRLKPDYCLEDEAQTVTRPKAIDVAAERRKLADLKAKRSSLARAAERAIEVCRKTYPR